jgi:hypothetical protein
VGKRLDQNFLSQAGADAEAGIANLANQAALAAEELYFLFFAKAHFAQAMGHFRRGGELLDAHGHARANVAQRAKEWLRTMSVILALRWLRLFHSGRIGHLRLSCKKETKKGNQEKNKSIALEAFETLFNERDYAKALNFWSPKYIQLGARIPPGREGLFCLEWGGSMRPFLLEMRWGAGSQDRVR